MPDAEEVRIMYMMKKAAKRSKPVAKPKSVPAPMSSKQALSVVTSKVKSVEDRLAALAQVTPAISSNDDNLQAVLGVVRDVSEPVPLRMAVLNALQAASFSVVAFQSCQSDYRATLRKIAQDPNQELRERALGLLAREKDAFAQKKLLDGLENPDKALVAPEKALQLLSYDVHAAAYRAARAIVEHPVSPEAKFEALRLLATDPTAIPMFEKIVSDKDELRANRQVSASALHALDPEKLQSLARNIVLDTSDYDDIKATSLTALKQFGDPSKLAEDKTLRKSVSQMKTKGSALLRQSASQFLSKPD
jgi:hypothetical protein